MISISLENQKSIQPLNFREKIIEGLKVWLVIKPLQIIYKKSAEKLSNELKNSPNGTIGNDIYRLLQEHQLSVIPKFENHDLKHLVLGYGMSSIEEVKMQMYLLGNGNYSISCLLFIASGILFPQEWKGFYAEYKKGKQAPSILDLSIHNCLLEKTDRIKATYNIV